MDAREELAALRRMAELEDKARGIAPKAATAEPPPSYWQQVGANIKGSVESAGNLAAGLVRGAGSIGSALVEVGRIGNPALGGKAAGSLFDRIKERNAGTDGGLQALGADTDSTAFGAGKITGEIAGTAGAGGVLARGAAAIPGVATSMPGLVNSIRTAGMAAGPAKAGVAGFAENALTRAAGGSITGGASAGVVSPSDAGLGAGIGAVTPGLLQIAGKVGGSVFSAVKAARPNSGQMLADALGVDQAELTAMVKAIDSAPGQIVADAPLTLSQALQTQGANTPGVKMLERIVAGGPGGDKLLKRYENQGVARLNALQAEGAQTYQGAAREEATKAGDKIGAVLRTQSADENQAARETWERLYGRASKDRVALQFPLDAMDDAMRPLGRGTVGAGKDAEALIRTANEIGTDTMPGTMATTARVGETEADRSLGQAGLVVPKAVPFDEFQRLRRSSGALGAKVGERAGGEVEAGVLNEIQRLLESRVDDAAAGRLLSGEVMPAGFATDYNAARGMTRDNAGRWGQSNNIGAILRRPVGQDYTLTGDEITNKLWHGGGGLAGDVANLKSVLNDVNREPAMNALRGSIMTDAASKTAASGALGAALPRYVEGRMPGLREAMTPSQLNALSSVANDIRNAEAAAAVPGLRGSDTEAKIARALDAGLLDASGVKSISKLLSFKGVGVEPVREKLAGMVMRDKGATLAELLSDPRAAALALQDARFVSALAPPDRFRLQDFVARSAPVLATNQNSP